MLGEQPTFIQGENLSEKEYSADFLRSQRLYVMKFGGTSVGSPEMIWRTADIIASYHRRGLGVVPVVSAMSGITNRLIELAESSLPEQQLRQAAEIYHYHRETAEKMFKRGLPVIDELQYLYTQLVRDLRDRSMSPNEYKDRISTYGERFSARLVDVALRRRLWETKSEGKSTYKDTTGIIVTDELFGEATPNDEKTLVRARRIPRYLDENIIPVMTGFIGATEDGRFTTLGRNGSDYSASYLAKLFPAEEVIIWTDVDGIYDKDPNKFDDAVVLPYLTFEQADIMAKNGAKLQPRTIEPLFGTSIRLRVKNTFNPDAPGTLIACESELNRLQ